MQAEPDIRPGRLTPGQIAANFADLSPPLTAMQAQQESARCLYCFDAPCTEACPTGIDIPGFIRGIATGNLRGAAMTILEANIMGGTCARVCPVEELCEQVCVKAAGEHQPVAIGRLQRHATDHLFASGEQPFGRAPDSGRTVAVVGAGPAGLACAHLLARKGHRVTVYESRSLPGGLNEHGIAAYKVVDGWAAREVAFILGVGGISVETNRRLGRDLSLDDLRQRFDAVFLGLGHNAANALGLEHESAGGVQPAVEFIERVRLEDLDTLPVGRNVVVIGGGNTAIDIAVQARKLGAESVTLVYRREAEAMSATGHEQDIARLNGVLIQTGAQPHALVTEYGAVRGVVFERTHTSAAGRLEGTGETFTLPADQVFKAVGQRFDPDPLATETMPAIENGRIRVDGERRTSLSNVWAGGDCVAGRDLTVVAVQDGKLAARSIDAYLRNLGV